MQSELQRLREQVIEAHAQRAPLYLRGAGTKDFYGESREGAPLELEGYRGVLDYEPSELVLSARCGTRLSEVEALLGEHRQYLAFEPPAFAGDPTLGGIVAAGLSGPRRAQCGAARDFVLGAVLLATDGEALHFGGRVMKNVAGFDVARLLCGSLGVLGPILELSLKVLPRPRAEQTLRFQMSEQQALETFNRWAAEPLPLAASAWQAGSAWVLLAGAEPAVRAARARLGGDAVADEEASSFWASLRHHTHPALAQARSLWRLSLPSTAPAMGIAEPVLIEWSGALRWYATDAAASELRALAERAGGTALHWRGGAPGERFHPVEPTVLSLHRRLKERFDPHRIFNRGRLFAED